MYELHVEKFCRPKLILGIGASKTILSFFRSCNCNNNNDNNTDDTSNLTTSSNNNNNNLHVIIIKQ